MSDPLPTVMTAAGLQPISPATLRQMLLDLVSGTSPGYTANLPGTLVEDIASTDVFAMTLMDQARVELVNSVTPLGANVFIMRQLGQIYGVNQGETTNTSVEVSFTAVDSSDNPVPGLVISRGFLVSDGTYQYSLSDGGITRSDGTTGNLSAVATQGGIWAVPAGSVVQLVTGGPPDITLSVTNALPGTPGALAEDDTAYRARVLRAGLAATQGMTRYLKTLLTNVAGVENRLVSARQVTGGWEIIVGGTGDNYEVANAINSAVGDVSVLVGSSINVTGITQANPGVVTTDLNHGYSSGQIIRINGALGMVGINNVNLTATVYDERTFSIGVDTTLYPAWTSGGVVTPNARNVVVNINDYPDIYAIPFVLPPRQTIDVVITWNTEEANFISAATVAQLGAPKVVDYINSIPVGQPFNILDASHVFHASIEEVLPLQFLTRLLMTVSINGVSTPPNAGTFAVHGDPESYFFADSTSVQVSQG